MTSRSIIKSSLAENKRRDFSEYLTVDIARLWVMNCGTMTFFVGKIATTFRSWIV